MSMLNHLHNAKIPFADKHIRNGGLSKYTVVSASKFTISCIYDVKKWQAYVKQLIQLSNALWDSNPRSTDTYKRVAARIPFV